MNDVLFFVEETIALLEGSMVSDKVEAYHRAELTRWRALAELIRRKQAETTEA